MPEKTSGRGWESARPQTPHTQSRGALPGHPHAAPKARKASSRCGVGDGSPRPHPLHRQPVGSGPLAARPNGREVWVGRAPDPGRPTPSQEAPPPGILMQPPQRAKPAHNSARSGVDDGSSRPHPPHPQPVGSGPRPHARKDEWSGMAERPTPDAPHPGRRRPRRAPLCRPRSAQSQLARARAVGLVTGANARTTRTHSQWVVGPGRTPEWTRGRGWESAQPRTSHTQARGAPPRAPSCRPHSAQTQLARARALGLVPGPQARSPRTHSQWVVGPGRTPERTSGRGWVRGRPRTPHTQARGAPPGHPHAAPTACKDSTQERALWDW